MIDYGKGAKRTLFVDKNKTLYTRIEDENKNVNFVKIYKTPDEIKKAFVSFPLDQQTIDHMSQIPMEIDVQGLARKLDTLIQMNVELLKLKESVACLLILPAKPEVKKEMVAELKSVEDTVDVLTYAWAQVGKAHPNYIYNYRPSLFEIPGVTKRILDGEETFKDAYGTIETSNHQAYNDMIIRDMMNGVDVLSPTELTRIDNLGLDKNKRLEQEYQASQKKL